MSTYANTFNEELNPNQTSQRKPIPGREGDMKQNYAGGYTFTLDKWGFAMRFLILGSEAPTYYTSARTLTLENAKNIYECIKEDGARLVKLIEEVNVTGRAAKKDPSIFALALAKVYGDVNTRRAAYASIANRTVLWTGRQLMDFLQIMRQLENGKLHFGRGMRNAVNEWYNGKGDDKAARNLAMQLAKYRADMANNHTITHGDIMRMAHYKPLDEDFERIRQWTLRDFEHQRDNNGQPVNFDWITGDVAPDKAALEYIWAFERAQKATGVQEILDLIRLYGLTHEMIPNTWFKHGTDTESTHARKVWRMLLGVDGGWVMPTTAMLRNLGRMTALDMFKPFADEGAVEFVVKHLTNEEIIKRSNVHPITVLNALRTYESSKGFRSDLSWDVSGEIVRALNQTFLLAFDNIIPAGKNTLLALDVSGSMGSASISALPALSVREASAAMAMATMKTEPNVIIGGFTSGNSGGGYWSRNNTPFTLLPFHKDMTITEIVNKTARLDFGGTDCALPMIYALNERLAVETFVIYTDSETWAGSIHPTQALQEYRKTMGIDAKLIVVGMSATEFSIADPDNSGMLDVVGFDSAAPGLIADFSAGRLFA